MTFSGQLGTNEVFGHQEMNIVALTRVTYATQKIGRIVIERPFFTIHTCISKYNVSCVSAAHTTLFLFVF